MGSTILLYKVRPREPIEEITVLTSDEVSDIILSEGYLSEGVSGVSADLRDITAAIDSGNKRAELAYNILAYQIKKYIGSYTAAMNGLDCVVFTAGVGENDARLRALALENMSYYGIELDKEKNTTRGEMVISTENSKVKVLVIPTNEELVIASDTMQIISEAK